MCGVTHSFVWCDLPLVHACVGVWCDLPLVHACVGVCVNACVCVCTCVTCPYHCTFPRKKERIVWANVPVRFMESTFLLDFSLFPPLPFLCTGAPCSPRENPEQTRVQRITGRNRDIFENWTVKGESWDEEPLCVCMYVCTLRYVYTYLCIYTYVYDSAYIYKWKYVYLYGCVIWLIAAGLCTYMYRLTCKHINIHMCIYVYTYNQLDYMCIHIDYT